MLRYDYEIIYKKGIETVVIDTLSRQYEDIGSLLALLVPILEWLEVACCCTHNNLPLNLTI